MLDNRAVAALDAGLFADELTPISVPGKRGAPAIVASATHILATTSPSNGTVAGTSGAPTPQS